jgi:pimeloyl-ACP methyl ester carboxylesterase
VKRFAGQLIQRAAAGLDRAVTLAVRASNSEIENEPALGHGHEARIRSLRSILARYEALPGHTFFPEPRAIQPAIRERRTTAGGLTRTDVNWVSLSASYLPELQDQYFRTLENHQAIARLLTRGAPRPVAILVHGYMMGRLAIEERIWPVADLDALGLDCAFLVLPFHAARADPRRTGQPEFPGRDPRLSNEGFRQAITELRELTQFLRRRGHPAVGVMGMSLGAYTAALAATVEAELDFVVPMIPLASLPDFALEQGRLPDAPEPRALEHNLLERVHRLVSPLDRTPLVGSERVLVIGAKADRITPLSHARRLANHFKAPLATFGGGHLLQLGRGVALERVGELLRGLRIV